jgi:hypothetical protein
LTAGLITDGPGLKPGKAKHLRLIVRASALTREDTRRCSGQIKRASPLCHVAFDEFLGCHEVFDRGLGL